MGFALPLGFSRGSQTQRRAKILLSLHAAAAALLGSTPEGEAAVLQSLLAATTDDPHAALIPNLKSNSIVQNDTYNQYSIPYGIPSLRTCLMSYYKKLYGATVDAETEVTVTLGATEGMSAALRALLKPGDGVCVLEPFHEMYVNQCQLFWLVPHYVTLHFPADGGKHLQSRWELRMPELQEVLQNPVVKAFILNSPHNPTGKVFNDEELKCICELCVRHDVLLFTDEIYEHIIYATTPHRCLLNWPDIRSRLVLVNSISKTGCATGWRVGWVIASPIHTTAVRAVHDTMAMQSPTPLQRAAEALLKIDATFYQDLVTDFKRKRATLGAALRGVGFHANEPEGAYYFFARYDDVPALAGMHPESAAMYLTEKIKVACVQGDNFFGSGRPGQKLRYLRFAFCRSTDQLEEAAKRLLALKKIN
eukprot:GHVT01013097.1.p1 GENE.GHVT01013097.1~~GHVT01013097.1.p1  ORF type:complete len:421 (+),score=73.50 GHVT01013097.1:1351-2613(+)